MANLQVEFKGNGIIKIWSKQYNFNCFSVPRKSITTSVPDMDTKMIVYFLVDSFEGKREKRKLYVGKTAKGMTRFFNHKREKEWWDKVFIFTAGERVFDEGTILGLENLLISRFKASGLYTMNQEGSSREIDEDCEFFGEQIIGIMDFLGYSLENYESNDEEIRVEASSTQTDTAKEASQLFEKLDNAIKNLSPHITSDQLKLYTSYKFENKNVCAVWLHSYGLEVELYISLADIATPNVGAYDVTNRKRGRRESAIKITNADELAKAMQIIKQIVQTI